MLSKYFKKKKSTYIWTSTLHFFFLNSTKDASELYSERQWVETADFSAINWKFEGCNINTSLKRLFRLLAYRLGIESEENWNSTYLPYIQTATSMVCVTTAEAPFECNPSDDEWLHVKSRSCPLIFTHSVHRLCFYHWQVRLHKWVVTCD